MQRSHRRRATGHVRTWKGERSSRSHSSRKSLRAQPTWKCGVQAAAAWRRQRLFMAQRVFLPREESRVALSLSVPLSVLSRSLSLALPRARAPGHVIPVHRLRTRAAALLTSHPCTPPDATEVAQGRLLNVSTAANSSLKPLSAPPHVSAVVPSPVRCPPPPSPLPFLPSPSSGAHHGSAMQQPPPAPSAWDGRVARQVDCARTQQRRAQAHASIRASTDTHARGLRAGLRMHTGSLHAVHARTCSHARACKHSEKQRIREHDRRHLSLHIKENRGVRFKRPRLNSDRLPTSSFTSRPTPAPAKFVDSTRTAPAVALIPSCSDPGSTLPLVPPPCAPVLPAPLSATNFSIDHLTHLVLNMAHASQVAAVAAAANRPSTHMQAHTSTC
eukprot:1994308-Pleurochrysis_carterae.AAC.1